MILLSHSRPATAHTNPTLHLSLFILGYAVMCQCPFCLLACTNIQTNTHIYTYKAPRKNCRNNNGITKAEATARAEEEEKEREKKRRKQRGKSTRTISGVHGSVCALLFLFILVIQQDFVETFLLLLPLACTFRVPLPLRERIVRE